MKSKAFIIFFLGICLLLSGYSQPLYTPDTSCLDSLQQFFPEEVLDSTHEWHTILTENPTICDWLQRNKYKELGNALMNDIAYDKYEENEAYNDEKKAILCYMLAARIFEHRRSQNLYMAGKCHFYIAGKYLELYEHTFPFISNRNKALAAATQSRDHFQKLAPDSGIHLKDRDHARWIGKTHHQEALVYAATGEHPSAIEQLNIAIEQFKRFQTDLSSEKVEKADSSLLQRQIRLTKRGLGAVLSLKANLLVESNHPHAAIFHAEAAKRVFLSLDQSSGINQIRIANCHQITGFALFKQQKYEESLDAFSQAITIRKQLNSTDRLSDLYMNRGVAFKRLNQLTSAKRSLNEAEIAARSYISDNSAELAKIHNNRGDIAMIEGKYKQALEHQHCAILQLLPQVSDEDPLADFPSVEQLIIKDSKFHLFIYLTAKAAALRQVGRQIQRPALSSALRLYLQADTVLFRMLKEQEQEASRAFWIDTTLIHYAYEDAIDLCYQMNKPHEAFYFMEKRKATLLLAKLREKNARMLSGIPEAFLDQERLLRDSMVFYERNYTRFLQTDNALGKEDNSKHLDELIRQRLRAQTIWTRHIQMLEKIFPRYYQLKYEDKVASVEVVQTYLKQQMDTSAALIEYFEGREFFYLICIEPDTLVFRRVEKHPRLVDFLQFVSGNHSLKKDTAYAQLSHQLYRQLIASVEWPGHSLPKRLVLIPDGSLSNFPFDALLKEPVQENYFPDSLYMLYEYLSFKGLSASALLNPLQHRSPSADGLFGMAPETFTHAGLNMLRGSASMMEQVVEKFGGNVRIRSMAHFKAFESYAPLGQILYLFTHAEASLQGQEEPWIALYDTLLHLRDLQYMNFAADLVMLAACETHQGTFQRGEGNLSFSRGFLYLGVPSVLASNWKVEAKSTGVIMELFLQELANGKRKDVALWEAKKSFLKAYRAQDAPYYWASFSLIGDPAAIPSFKARGNEPGKWSYVLGGIFLFAILSFIFRNQIRKLL